MPQAQRIAKITLDEKSVVRRNADIEHERQVAIFDLLEENCFVPAGGQDGPFHLRLALEDNRLVLDLRDMADAPLERILLPLAPFRGIIKDYFLVCESYFAAIRRSSPAQIEAIDMGRRGLHNEGSELLRESLAEKVTLDLNTARRLFTLVCVLHIRG
ncbi:MAG: UPF0262 family protein [Alphaproteobacteria bacterium]|nr:UPF0262 family protein [Alphaproteobacteria bacterium]